MIRQAQAIWSDISPVPILPTSRLHGRADETDLAGPPRARLTPRAGTVSRLTPESCSFSTERKPPEAFQLVASQTLLLQDRPLAARLLVRPTCNPKHRDGIVPIQERAQQGHLVGILNRTFQECVDHRPATETLLSTREMRAGTTSCASALFNTAPACFGLD